jgi:hypothetical protein
MAPGKTIAHSLLVGFPLFAGPLSGSAPPGGPRWWAAEVERALARAGANRAELVKALRAVPAGQRKGLAFLRIGNMPEGDLRSLSADFLLEDVGLAYKARD